MSFRQSSNFTFFSVFVTELKEEKLPSNIQMDTLFSVTSGSKYVYGRSNTEFLALISALSLLSSTWKSFIFWQGTSSVKCSSGYWPRKIWWDRYEITGMFCFFHSKCIVVWLLILTFWCTLHNLNTYRVRGLLAE